MTTDIPKRTDTASRITYLETMVNRLTRQQGITTVPKNSGYVVNVKDLGALGDGVTDDGSAFRQAMDVICGAGGGTIYVPPGTYVINDVVRLCDNLILMGDGARITKTVWSPYSVFVALSDGSTGYGSGVRNVLITGLTFVGDLTNDHAINVSLHHAQHVVFDRCTFEQAQGIGHCIDLAGCDGITVRDCDFLGFKNYSTSGFSRAEAVQLDHSAKGGISYEDSPGSYDGLPTIDVTIDNCRFLPFTVGPTTYPCPNPVGCHSVREGQYFENVQLINSLIVDPIDHDPNNETFLYGVVHFVGTRGIKISGNIFRQNVPTRTNRAVMLTGANTGIPAGSDPNGDETSTTLPAPMLCSDAVIDGNTFDGFRPQNASTFCDTITLRGVSGTGQIEDVRVSNNTIFGGLNLAGSTSPLKNAIRVNFGNKITITGNTVTDENAGMLIQSSQNVTVTGNAFRGIWFRGITLTSATDVIFTSNLLIGRSAASSIGVQHTGTPGDDLVAHNIIKLWATDMNPIPPALPTPASINTPNI